MLDDRTNNELGNMSDVRMTFSAVLLAGGESRRMGRDKAAVVFHGEPLWRRQLRILRDLGPEKVFVSARTESSWLPADTELLLDEPPSRGPLSGLTKAIVQMQTSHLLALAVDMPFMTREQLRLLCTMISQGRGVVPVLGDRAEPLAAVYPATAAADFVTALGGTDFSLQPIVRRLVAAEKLELFAVPAEDRHIYRSVNEPADIEDGRFPTRPPQNVGDL
jgi:molybdopterin-guanine dinucleotide biosynthesis protein A